MDLTRWIVKLGDVDFRPMTMEEAGTFARHLVAAKDENCCCEVSIEFAYELLSLELNRVPFGWESVEGGIVG